jgi:GT2 family glycosyltransferase
MAPELSVVILSYNQFDQTTGPCLASLSKVDTLDCEIIVVDNGSDDITLEHLTAAASKNSRIRLILNKENRGYAGGNNDGVAQAQAEAIVLLNSDTRVLPESLPLLVSQLANMSGPTVVGPVTNAAGNEQQLFIKSGTVQSILDQGSVWSSHAGGSFFSTDQLSFFCVAMLKKTYLDLGGLDESFSLGFYEDADFCYRAVMAGVDLQVMEEAFVYHAGSASFSTMPEMTKKLLKQNKKRFREKNGKVKLEHVRYKNLHVMRGYVEAQDNEGNSQPFTYRFQNRMCRAHELIPNNPLKKILYLQQLKKLVRMAKK